MALNLILNKYLVLFIDTDPLKGAKKVAKVARRYSIININIIYFRSYCKKYVIILINKFKKYILYYNYRTY